MMCLKRQPGLHCSHLRKESGEDAVLSYETHGNGKWGCLDIDIFLDSRLCKVWFAQHHRRWLRLRGTLLGASCEDKGYLAGYGFLFSDQMH